MAIYREPAGHLSTPSGVIEWEFEFDDGGTPPSGDDTLVNVYWRNPDREPALVTLTFTRSGQVRATTLAGNNPNWVQVPVPPQFNARKDSMLVKVVYPVPA